MSDPSSGDKAGYMSLSRALAALGLSVTIALSGAAMLFYGSGTAHEVEGPELPGVLGVTWAFEPSSVAEMSSETRALVLAKVLTVEAGPPLVGEIDGEVIERPTERVHLQVDEVLEGTAPAEITLFKIGDAADVYLAGDPPYVAGQQYLMFVSPRLNDEGTAPNADGTWLPVAPEGRLATHSSGTVEAFVDTPVAEALEGDTVDEIDERVDEVGG